MSSRISPRRRAPLPLVDGDGSSPLVPNGATTYLVSGAVVVGFIVPETERQLAVRQIGRRWTLDICGSKNGSRFLRLLETFKTKREATDRAVSIFATINALPHDIPAVERARLTRETPRECIVAEWQEASKR